MPVRLIRPKRFADARGWFCETYNRRALAELGIDAVFCQDNLSLSRAAGTLRGLHFQRPPHAQAKLISCPRGRIWDVAIDIRAGSPTHGKWVAAELSAENGRQLFIPVGFAHGLITLEPMTEVGYKVSDFHAPECEDGLAWDDPDLSLPWPPVSGGSLLSEKDRGRPAFAGFESPFAYDGIPLEPLET